jgi:hypothetical protein
VWGITPWSAGLTFRAVGFDVGAAVRRGGV